MRPVTQSGLRTTAASSRAHMRVLSAPVAILPAKAATRVEPVDHGARVLFVARIAAPIGFVANLAWMYLS